MSLFSPGATRFCRRDGRNRCLWREESFLFHLFRAAVDPALGLRECLESWDLISLDLREPPRKRRLQMEELELQESLLS